MRLAPAACWFGAAPCRWLGRPSDGLGLVGAWAALPIDRSGTFVHRGGGRFTYRDESCCRDCAVTAAEADGRSSVWILGGRRTSVLLELANERRCRARAGDS